MFELSRPVRRCSRERNQSIQGHLVVGVDGSESSIHGLRTAITLATNNQCQLIVVFVRPPSHQTWVSLTGCGVCSLGDDVDCQQAIAEAQIVTLLSGSRVPWCYEVRTGEPSRALIRAADEHKADTILLTQYRSRIVERLLHGPTIARLSRRWSGALLTVDVPLAGEPFAPR